MIESRPAMSRQLQPERLARLSAHLEGLFLRILGNGPAALAPELADEIAATAGEVMVELADHREDGLAQQVIEDARRLREAARTIYPEPARVAESGRALVSDLGLLVSEDRRAA
jgi:hypothetical protein